jgi:hypothetical protein
MKTRFDLEDMLMKCWHVTDDIDLVADMVGDMDIKAKDKDKLMNVLIGLKELYNARYNAMFVVFEDMVKHQYFEKPAPAPTPARKHTQEFLPHD